MVRRRSRPKEQQLPDPLPKGWIAHDGGGMPVDPDSKPALWMRSGQRMQGGERTAASWTGWGGRKTGSCWIWEDDAFDIVAFKP
ncbi:MAG: hypothetical protein GW855_04250 [Erythrobacter sp.]|nr:hypothetical protein [Erythrobacter sp.]